MKQQQQQKKKGCLFLALLGLCCCAQVSASCGKHGLPCSVHGLLIAVVSLVVEYRLQTRGLQSLPHVGLVIAAPRLSCSMPCGIFLEQGLKPCSLHCKLIAIHCITRDVPNAILNRNGQSGHPYFIPDIRRKTFSFHH